MARYIRDFQLGVAPQNVHSAVNQYLQSEGYEYINYDGENVFKKGNGIMSGPTFFKFSYSGNMVRMETWMKYSLFPGVYIGELGLDGFVGVMTKGPWKSRIGNLENMLSNMSLKKANDFYVGYSNAYNETQILNDNDNETQILTEDDNGTQILSEFDNETRILTEDDNGTQILKSYDVLENANRISDGISSNKIINDYLVCNECGNQISAAASFCPICGQKQIAADVINISQQSNSFYQPNVQKDNINSNQHSANHCAVSRKEFINNYAQPYLKKDITIVSILCYICAASIFIISCVFNPLGIIDAVLMACLTLGMQISKNRIFAILILILCIIEVIISIISGSFSFWLLAAGILSVVTFIKVEKQYKQFKNS